MSRSRKDTAVPPVPANCSPKALAALRTLLAGIARKCFRMAPDERRHALPLLNNVEQAVIPPQSSSGLVALATEVLEEIIFHLDTPRDLRTLGATCQRLRKIVHPRHTEYRFIRCRPSLVWVWHHLARHPGLARNVHHLHITDNQETVPSRARGRTRENQVDFCGRDRLWDVLACMTTLAKFSWSHINGSTYFEDISPTLLMCSSLREVEIRDHLIFRPLPAEVKSQSENFHLSGVTCVTISSQSSSQEVKQPSLDRIQWFLTSHCPNLTTLRIVYCLGHGSVPLVDEFLLRGRWPSLRTLKLKYFKVSRGTGINAVAKFLAAHPSIEELDFEIVVNIGEVRLDLPVGTLPHLRYLACNNGVAASILRCPMTEGQTHLLKELRVPWIGHSPQNDAFIEGLRLCPKLKRIESQSYNEITCVKRLAEAARNITWLSVGRVGGVTGEYDDKAVSSVKNWAPVLSVLPKLTTFYGVCFFHKVGAGVNFLSERSRIKKNDEVASMLLRICPKLRRVDYWNRSKAIVLSKEGNKVKWELRCAKKGSASCRSRNNQT